MQKTTIRVLMFGPGLTATSGISAVVNHWLDAGIGKRLQLDYVSTLDDYVPGQYVVKFGNAIRAYRRMLTASPRPDLVHLHLSHGMSFYRKLVLFLIARMRGLKTAVHLHGSTFKEFYSKGSGVRQHLIRFLFDKADVVIVLSDAWKQFVEGISDNTRIVVVPNGAPVRASGLAGEKGKNPNGTVSILFMGRLGQRKGVYDLLEAFDRLSREVPNARLMLGGDGEIERVGEEVEKRGLQSRVQILGWVDGRKKFDVFDQADIYTLPSYNEGLPGSILEAMTSGAPIVSTPVGGIPEAVIDGVNGYLVEPGDIDSLYERLLKLCASPDLRHTMGAASRRMIEEKFDITKIVDNLLKIYESTVAQQR